MSGPPPKQKRPSAKRKRAKHLALLPFLSIHSTPRKNTARHTVGLEFHQISGTCCAYTGRGHYRRWGISPRPETDFLYHIIAHFSRDCNRMAKFPGNMLYYVLSTQTVGFAFGLHLRAEPQKEVLFLTETVETIENISQNSNTLVQCLICAAWFAGFFIASRVFKHVVGPRLT